MNLDINVARLAERQHGAFSHCQAVAAGALQETEQFAMGSGLRHAVHVEPGIDLLPPA